MTMRRALHVIVPMAFLAVAPITQSQDRAVISLATATPGGGFPVHADAFAAVINQTDATLLVQTRNTKGSAENIPLLEND